MTRLLLHSTDPKLQPLLASALGAEFCLSVETEAGRFLKTVADGHFDVVILDCDSNRRSTDKQIELYDGLGGCKAPVIVMTDDTRRSTAIEFLQRGAYDCVRKPPSIMELKVILRRAYEHHLMKLELAGMREASRDTSRCDQLIGSSGRSQVVYDLIRRVANLNAFVLITGESGTGKELVARAVHNLGSRAGQPFVAVSCGAIPETLIEAELFGCEKGAFTGSAGSRAGYMEEAGEGTLFLDEIGELSLQTQVKLLRVLQQREFSRLGSSRLLPLKARVLFATHRNLEELVEAGTFRQDLFYRVNVMKINIPPLRERTEDIPMLARHFLERYSAECGKPIHDIRPNAMELLVEYDWPGNVRELENVIQRAVIFADDEAITPADLPDRIRQLDETLAQPLETDSFGGLLRQFKVQLAHKTIMECNGNKSLAARKLRVSRAYLHRLIRVSPDESELLDRQLA